MNSGTRVGNRIRTTLAAKTLGVHAETIRRYVTQGKLRATKVRGRWRFEAAEILTFKKYGPPVGRVGDVARALGVHPNTVIAWSRQGPLALYESRCWGSTIRSRRRHSCGGGHEASWETCWGFLPALWGSCWACKGA
jgi:excisionase family DNA binding protein